jgi:alkylated DNA repair dioxygenase AlkB
MKESIVSLPFRHYPKWLENTVATHYFERLSQVILWEQEHLVLYGKNVAVPRKVAFYGDVRVHYIYSKRLHHALSWLPELIEIKEALTRRLSLMFNSVLCNYYRNGEDYMGWHADNEPELGINPIIASLSLGATRKFVLRHRQTHQKITMMLAHGDLLIMQDTCQIDWQHALPKSRGCVSPRINLTFRTINNKEQK